MEQFYELCDLYRWDRDGPQKTEARKGIKAALVLEFNDLFGKDDNSLQTWVELATIIGLSPIPDEVNKCREVCLIYILLYSDLMIGYHSWSPTYTSTLST